MSDLGNQPRDEDESDVVPPRPAAPISSDPYNVPRVNAVSHEPEQPVASPYSTAGGWGDTPAYVPYAKLTIAGFIVSLVGLFTGLLVLLPGLVLSIVGLVQANKYQMRGRGFGIAGIVISAVGLLINVVLLVAILGSIGQGCTTDSSGTFHCDSQYSSSTDSGSSL